MWKEIYDGGYALSFWRQTSEFQLGLEVVQKLRNAGFETYMVGGCVRDALLGRKGREIDIATQATPKEILSIFPGAKKVGARFGVIQVSLDSQCFEIATFRRDSRYVDGRHPVDVTFCSAQEDAYRRDFTINALYYDPVEDKIFDQVGGMKDLKQGLIRAIGDPQERMQEDYLRLLRAVRIACELRFVIDPELTKVIQSLSQGIRQISVERITMELERILTSDQVRNGVELLAKLHLLEEILPEVAKMQGVQQNPAYHPEGDVWIHTLMMLERMVWKDVTLSWAILLHDVGKPITQSVERGEICFYRHEHEGSRIAQDILERLHCSNELKDRVSAIIRRHMSFVQIMEMRPATLRRWMSSPDFGLELELHRLDCLCSSQDFTTYWYALDQLSSYQSQPLIPPPLLRGEDIIACGVKPGPRIGQLLRMIQELQMEGKIQTRDEAQAWLHEQVKKGR